MRVLLALAVIAGIRSPGTGPQVAHRNAHAQVVELPLNQSIIPPSSGGALAAPYDWFMSCGVEADACGDGYGWHCYEADGTEITVTNPCGGNTESTPFTDGAGAQMTGVKVRAANQAPYIAAATAAAADLDDIWLGDHTLVFVHRNTPNPVGGEADPFGHGSYLADGAYVSHGDASTVFTCAYNTSGAFTSSSTPAFGIPSGAWYVGSCRVSGTTATARVNGNDDASPNAITTPVIPTTRDMYFGSASSGNIWNHGTIISTLIYNRALTAAELTTIEANYQGIQGTPSPLTLDRNSLAYIETADGQFEGVSQDMTIAGAAGASIEAAVTNYGANSLDATAWTAVGTPVVTADQDSGPFSRLNNGAEADSINDDDGAGAEGTYQALSTTQTGAHVYSVFAKYSSATGPALAVTTDGTGSVTCTVTGFDDLSTASISAGGTITCLKGAACTGSNGYGPGADYARLTCTATVGGVPSYTRGYFYPAGDTAANTGVTLVSDGEGYRIAYAPRPCPDLDGGGSACVIDAATDTTTNWPTAHGRIVLDYTPGRQPTAAAYFASALSASDGYAFYRDAAADTITFDSRVSSTTTSCTTAALTLTNGTTYALEVRWNGVVNEIYQDQVLKKTCTTGKVVASVPSVGIGTTNGLRGTAKNLRISR